MPSSPLADDRPESIAADRAHRLEVAVTRALAELELLVASLDPDGRAAGQAVPAPLPDHLVGRRRQVAEMAVQGLPTTTIAAHLGLSPNTVRNHLKAACRCLGIRSRTELVARYRA